MKKFANIKQKTLKKKAEVLKTSLKKEISKKAVKKVAKKVIEKPVKKKKVIVKKEVSKKVVEKKKESSKKVNKYYSAIGRRKTAVARIRLFTQGKKEFLVNNKSYKDYFPTLELQKIASASLETMKCLERFYISAKVKGGGVHSQAEAIRHGIARALILFNSNFHKRLKKVGYLTRDPRMRERKKFGLKRARRAPQWQKR